MTIAQAYLAALARDWDSKLAGLQRALEQPATRSSSDTARQMADAPPAERDAEP
jgi:hypothetical protein